VGLIPPEGTKQTHRGIRDQCKNVILAVNYGMGAEALALRLGTSVWRAEELLQLHHRAYPTYWQWPQSVQDFAMLHARLHTAFGWQVVVGANPNTRSLRNFPAQANGAEILRLSCIMAHRAGIQICAPIHDALLIEAPTQHIDDAVMACRQAMSGASERVLPGFPLRTDVKVVRWPDRYGDSRGTRIWEEIWSLPFLKALNVNNDVPAYEQVPVHQRAPVQSHLVL
jgi:DNA polymerase I-like protein with 3'-5' exonuclease and polymerase domains